MAAHLVAQGRILQASARVRHRDASTTLRHYVDALPLQDEAIADELDRLLTARDGGEP